MARWWRDLLIESHPGSNLRESVERVADTVLVKTEYDAFHNTRLEKDLHNAGVEQLVITGVLTHLCCETTARSAFVRGFDVFFPVDGSATYTRAHHAATLLNLGHGFATLCSVNDLLNRLGE